MYRKMQILQSICRMLNKENSADFIFQLMQLYLDFVVIYNRNLFINKFQRCQWIYKQRPRIPCNHYESWQYSHRIERQTLFIMILQTLQKFKGAFTYSGILQITRLNWYSKITSKCRENAKRGCMPVSLNSNNRCKYWHIYKWAISMLLTESVCWRHRCF